MKLIWTYDSKVNLQNPSKEKQTILINYYILSITEAKKFGYHTIIYVVINSVKYFENIADEIIVTEGYLNSPLWDHFKIKVLSERNDDFCLIDGDLIIHKKLPQLDSDVVFDSFEHLNWSKEYKPTIDTITKINTPDIVFDSFEYVTWNGQYKKTVKNLTEMRIKDLITEWSGERIPVMNIGLLYIKNEKFKDLYVEKWKIYESFIKEHIAEIDPFYATMVGAQYLLTLIGNHYGFTTSHLCHELGKKGDFYHHYCGPQKYKNPVVPTDYILKNASKKELF